MTDEYVSPIDGHWHYVDANRAECAVCCLEAERDRLRAVCDAVGAESIVEIVAERDRLRAVVQHVVETLPKSAPDAPGVLATVSLMRLALDPTGEDTDG